MLCKRWEKNIKIHKYLFTKLKSFGGDTLLGLPVRVNCLLKCRGTNNRGQAHRNGFNNFVGFAESLSP